MDNVIVGVDDPSIIESQPPISVDTDASRTTPAPGVIDMSVRIFSSLNRVALLSSVLLCPRRRHLPVQAALNAGRAQQL